ncbi:MAG: cobalamin biosynthesis protein CobW [Alphaproteobacteria bacterium]|nr:cobalamin biosynthesis protein CobW [Alphaproteobacteria bacterium]
MNRIPATVVTGFLGAGKTSLIQNLLRTAGGRRLAFVINEFGELGIDRELILGCGIEGCEDDDIVELANGCICCTVADDFLPSMKKLIERPEPPEHIIIETSGLALPKPLVQAFNWPEVKARSTVDGVIVVIDAAAVAGGRFADDPEAVARQRAADPNLDHENPLEEVYEDQLACADLVILNKSDLVSPADLARVRAEVTAVLRPGVKIVESRHGNLPASALLGLAAAAEDDLSNRPSHHDNETEHDHEDFESFAVALAPAADPQALEARILQAVEKFGVLRVKGFVEVPGKPLRHVIQGVGPRLVRHFDRPWKQGEARDGRLVVIGLKGLDRRGIEAEIRG